VTREVTKTGTSESWSDEALSSDGGNEESEGATMSCNLANKISGSLMCVFHRYTCIEVCRSLLVLVTRR
jgi:hypothetical protein